MRQLILLIFTFVFIATEAISISKYPSFSQETKHPQRYENNNFPKIPVLVGNSPPPVLSAQSALAVDVDSGIFLYQKNPEAKHPPASTTKIITALVALDYFDLDQEVEVGKVLVDGQKMRLLPGERIKVRDLIAGLLIYSANDAAEVLAANFPGGRDSFIAAMNSKAQQLHLSQSFFTNPTGLDGEGQVTSARDLVRASIVAMKNPFFRKVVSTKEVDVLGSDGKFVHKLVNINKLLGEVNGVLGIKTGWTENARENLVTYIQRDNKNVIIVVLGSEDRFEETRQIIDWIFTNYSWKAVNLPFFD